MIRTWIIAIVTVGLVSVFGYMYYDNYKAQQELDSLRTELTAVEAAKLVYENTLKATRETLEEERKLADQQFKEIGDLQNRLIDANEYSEQLRQVLQDHDLTRLAEEKPGLIENRINNATDDVFTDIEQFTRTR